MLITRILLVFFYNRWAQISMISTGARTGAFFGLFLAFSCGFFKMAMKTSMTAEFFTLDVAVSIGMTAATGTVVGGINGKLS